MPGAAHGYEYERFFSYYTMDEMRTHLDRLGLSVVDAEVSEYWMQLIARKP